MCVFFLFFFYCCLCAYVDVVVLSVCFFVLDLFGKFHVSSARCKTKESCYSGSAQLIESQLMGTVAGSVARRVRLNPCFYFCVVSHLSEGQKCEGNQKKSDFLSSNSIIIIRTRQTAFDLNFVILFAAVFVMLHYVVRFFCCFSLHMQYVS